MKTILPPKPLIELLRSLNCHEISHLDATMESHLIGTYANLQLMGARDALCVAGLFHAVDGTPNSQPAPRSANFGPLEQHIGIEASMIIRHYVECCRDFVWPQFKSHRPILYKNRFTGAIRPMESQELRDFCTLTTANELQIYQTRPGIWHPNDLPALAAIDGMQEFLTPEAWRLYESVRSAKLPLKLRIRRRMGALKRAIFN